MHVALSDPHGLAIVDISEKKVLRTVRCSPSIPSPIKHPSEPINTLTRGLALSPDERELWGHQPVGGLPVCR